MITYGATLDVSLSTVARVSGWLQAHRRAHDVRPWQRAATCWVQAVLVLRWFKDDTKVHLLARDARVSQATAYRYLHEAVDVSPTAHRSYPTCWPTAWSAGGRTCAWTAR